ncbi:variable surface lipoprotein [Mycoplasma sp. Sp33II]|uniref:variable surface lipoprotein n=1 Tax=unclassified Mycoplasma TaxID=2683645 RepID=UPI003AAF1309
MKKIKLLTILGLGSFTLLPLVAASCGDTRTQDQNNDQKEPIAPKPEPVNPGDTNKQPEPGNNPTPGDGHEQSDPAKNPQTPENPEQPGTNNPEKDKEPVQPVAPDTTVDENTKGGTESGLNINEYKSIISLLALNDKMTASKAYSLINSKSFKNDNYNLTNVKVTAFDDSKGTLSFTVTGKYKETSLDNVTFNVTGLFVVKRSMVLNLEWNTNKIMEEQKSVNDFVGKPFNEIKPYLSKMVLTIEGNAFDVLDNENFIVKTFSVTNNKNKPSASISVDYAQKILTNTTVNKVQEINVYHGTVDYFTGLTYTAQQYLGYILNNKLTVKQDINHEYYPSYFAGKKATGVDLWSQLFELDKKYELWNNEPVRVSVKYYPNDLTGKLFVSVGLVYEPGYGLGATEYGYKSFTFEGFKQLSKESLKNDFLVTPDSFEFIKKKTYRGLVDRFLSLSEEQRKEFKITDRYELTGLLGQFGGDNAIFSRLIESDGTQKLELVNSNSPYVKLYFKHKPLSEWPISTESRLLGDNPFQLGRIALKTTSLSNFKEVRSDNNPKVSFDWNFTLEIEVQNANSDSFNNEIVEIPMSASLFALQNDINQ